MKSYHQASQVDVNIIGIHKLLTSLLHKALWGIHTSGTVTFTHNKIACNYNIGNAKVVASQITRITIISPRCVIRIRGYS